MSKQEYFDNILTNSCKYETLIENYLVHPDFTHIYDEKVKLLAYNEPRVDVKEPTISIWDFLGKKELEEFMALESKSQIRKYISSMMSKNYPKGKTKKVFIELMYNITKFCKNSEFNLEQTGAVLSQFYLTHVFFTSRFDISAEKIYTYFKDIALCHSLPFPPNAIKLFSLKQTKEIMELFCKLYLRNLPLIRFLCLPNFALYLSYELEPEPKKQKGKKKEKKKGKK